MMTMTPARSVRYTLLAIALIATTGCSSPYPAPPDTRKDAGRGRDPRSRI